MNLAKIENILGRKLNPEEELRLQKLGKIFELRDDDALWDLIMIIEGHRESCLRNSEKIEDILNKFKEQLPKIKSTNYAESANFSVLNSFIILPIIVAVLLIYGAAAMWAGYYLGLGRPPQMPTILLMPVGYIIALSAVCPGVVFMIQAARDLSEGIHKKRGGLKAAGASLCFFIASSTLVLTAQYA